MERIYGDTGATTFLTGELLTVTNVKVLYIMKKNQVIVCGEFIFIFLIFSSTTWQFPPSLH